MYETVDECKKELSDMKVKFINIFSEFNSNKSEITLYIQKIEDMKVELHNIKKTYTSYKTRNEHIKNMKKDKIGNIEKQNIDLEREIKSCDNRHKICKSMYTDLEVSLDILKQKIKNSNRKLESVEIVNLEDIIKQDKVLSNINKDPNTIKDCKHMIDKLYCYTSAIKEEYKRLVDMKKIYKDNESELVRDIDIHTDMYKKERQMYKDANKNKEFSLLIDNYILRHNKEKCKKAVESCNLSFNNLKTEYAKFKENFMRLEEDRLAERSLKVAELDKAFSNMKISLESYPKKTKVKFNNIEEISYI